MALDTAEKRCSAIHLNCPWKGLLSVPSGSITQAARQAVRWFYSGIMAQVISFVVGISGGVVSHYVSKYEQLQLLPHRQRRRRRFN